MGYTFPALRGQMGSTTFYQATIRARDLAAVAKTAAELPQWTTWSVFERFQRELAERRVEKEIVPYLVRTKDRFFNSLIVLVFEPESFDFETFDAYAQGMPAAYKSAVEQMGFLTIDGGDLVVLDGQHRLAALRGVTTAGSELQGEYVDAVGDDELCVVFIAHESFEKTRRIFNKVNRYAKPTSPTDNIITSEDDGAAIVTRWLVEPEPPLGMTTPEPPLNGLDLYGEPIVEWRRTTLKPDDVKFTTLSALYQMTQVVLDANGMPGFNEKAMVNRPSDKKLKRAYEIVAEFWDVATESFSPWKRCVRRPALLPDHRSYQAAYSLLFRPAGQVAFVHALTGAMSLGMTLERALDAAEDAPWSASDPLFHDTVVYANGRMNANEAGVRLAGRLGTYLIAGRKMPKAAREQLTLDLQNAKANWGFTLPDL